MGTMWIVAANRGFAKIFEAKGKGREINEIHHLDNPEGRLKGSLGFTDRPGRTFDRLGGGRHSYEDKDIHGREQKLFVEHIIEFLQQGKNEKAFDELAFVAPAQFLGELNSTLPPGLKKILVKEIGKDLPENLSDQARIEQICKYLDLWNHSSTTSK